MKFENKRTSVMIILIILSLILVSTLNFFPAQLDEESYPTIHSVGQGLNSPNLHVTNSSIIINRGNEILNNTTVHPGDHIKIEVTLSNIGTVTAQYNAILYLQSPDEIKTEIKPKSDLQLVENSNVTLDFWWAISTEQSFGVYTLIVELDVTNNVGDSDLDDNTAYSPLIIRSRGTGSQLELETKRIYAYPEKKLPIFVSFTNKEDKTINVTVTLYYFPTGDESNKTEFLNQTIEAEPGLCETIDLVWDLPKLTLGQYKLFAEITEPDHLGYLNHTVSVSILEKPDSGKTPVYQQVWFIVGLISLIIFFLTIILSLLGYIPQDRLPIQPALVVMALVIMVIALIGNYLDPQVHLIGPQDIAGMVIIHPITALTAGFLVAGGLEASGAFAAAADALSRIEKLKFKGRTIFGFTGTVVILTNIPTLIAMPCGRILGAALMPAALFFGYRVAKTMGDARMVGVVVFPFIVNAAASCGPSPLGGIGTIGEGLSKMPIGSFTTAQSTGIMICTGVCALFMRYITFMRPADLSDEDIKRELEAEKQKAQDALEPNGKDKGKEEEAPLKAKAAPSASSTPPVAAKVVDEKTKAPLAKQVDGKT